MPDPADPKEREHPYQRLRFHDHHTTESLDTSSSCEVVPDYAELQVTTNFTFLTGASHPEEYVTQASLLGHTHAAITDCNSLAGIVRAHVEAKEAGIALAVGCRLELESPAVASTTPATPHISVLVYPTTIDAYGRLCQLLTLGKRRAPKGSCYLSMHDLFEYHEDLLAILLPPPHSIGHDFIEIAQGFARVFQSDDRLSIAVSHLYTSDDAHRLQQIAALANHVNLPMVATNDVHYHVPERRSLQDVVTCIKHGCTIGDAGRRLLPNGERHLKSATEMSRLFADYPKAIARTVEIATRAAQFNLDSLRYQYPDEICPSHRTPMEYLTALTWEGAADRFPDGVPDNVVTQLRHELVLIDELQYASYFLTVYDFVKFARSQGILCQGRGAAANSSVCYCLGVTSVDPSRIDLLVERFISHERNEPPDIDIDFEHERREEVIQYIYQKYGRDRAALTGVVITYRGRSAVREVGKALGLSLDAVDVLAKSMDWWDHGIVNPERMRELGLNPDDPIIQQLAALATELLGFPRHLSQHVGGFVITQKPLCQLVPIENAAMDDRTVIEWDKDDIDAMGMLKVDVLGLGMLTCIRKAFAFVNDMKHQTSDKGPCPTHSSPLALHSLPPDDPGVYDMICNADTVGVFQIESRAQMTMLPRLRPRCYYDLVIEVAIVRPGPIQGDMVHPYLRRRNGEEPIEYPSDDIKHILGKTLGVPLFQEQAMSLAMVAGGFTAGEADQLRRAMAAWKRKGDKLHTFGDKLIRGMLERGYTRDFAERCFNQLKGFSEYGFPESHAASFAHLVYVSAWLKHHYPAQFAAALLNSLPMGFYAPAQIVRDAQEHGVEVRSVDVNHSDWDCTLESPATVRLGFRMIRGLHQTDANAITAVTTVSSAHSRRFSSIESLWRASNLSVAVLKRLAKADAFQSMGLDRQNALWHIRALRDEELPLFDTPKEDTSATAYAPAALPKIAEPQKVAQDYATVGLSLKAHPVSFFREQLTAMRVTPARALRDEDNWKHGKWITVAGVVLVRQRPGTASGVVFMTLEDETGIANLIVRPHVYDQYRAVARHAVILLARGRVERQGQVVHVMTHRMEDVQQ